MGKTLVTPAEFKPLEIEAIKDRPELRITGTDSDLVLAEYLEAAVEHFQELSRSILCRSTWDVYFDAFESPLIVPGPQTTLEALSYDDGSGILQEVDASLYILDATPRTWAEISLREGCAWPTPALQANSVVARITAGYASPGAIPYKIKQGLIEFIQQLYFGVSTEPAWASAWAGYRRIIC
jgi:uncharacterized phiE125 gp8 family phage protein